MFLAEFLGQTMQGQRFAASETCYNAYPRARVRVMC